VHISEYDYDRFCLRTVVNDAKRYFNFELNAKKVKRTKTNGKIEFLGYKVDQG